MSHLFGELLALSTSTPARQSHLFGGLVAPAADSFVTQSAASACESFRERRSFFFASYLWMMVLRPESTGWALLLSQAMILVWLGTRLWQRAAETEWYKQYELAVYRPAAIAPLTPPLVPVDEAVVPR